MGCTEREYPESPPSSALGRKPTVPVYIDNFRPGVWIESLRNILLLFHQNIPGEQNIAGGRLCAIIGIEGQKERIGLAQGLELLLTGSRDNRCPLATLLGIKPGILCPSSPLAVGIRQRTLRGDKVMCQGCSAAGGEARVGCGVCEFELGLLVLEYSCSQLQDTVTGRGLYSYLRPSAG